MVKIDRERNKIKIKRLHDEKRPMNFGNGKNLIGR
jgi:hypothetical protein